MCNPLEVRDNIWKGSSKWPAPLEGLWRKNALELPATRYFLGLNDKSNFIHENIEGNRILWVNLLISKKYQKYFSRQFMIIQMIWYWWKSNYFILQKNEKKNIRFFNVWNLNQLSVWGRGGKFCNVEKSCASTL